MDVNKFEKIKSVLEYACLDIFIFMICSGIIHTLYSDNIGLATFGGFVAVFGCNPIVKIISNKSKEITK